MFHWVIDEVANEGYSDEQVDIYSINRPESTSITFDFTVQDVDASVIDELIENRTQEFIENGYQAINYPEGDSRHKEGLKNNLSSSTDEHEQLIDLVQALETLYYDDQVKEILFPETEGSLRELLADVDEPEALATLSQIADDLLITDEITEVLLGKHDPIANASEDVDSSLNCGYTVSQEDGLYEAQLDIPYGMITKDGTILEGEARQDSGKNILIELQKAMDAEVPGIVISRDKFVGNEDYIIVWYEVPEGEDESLKAKEAADTMTGVLEQYAGNFSQISNEESLNTSANSEEGMSRSEVTLDHAFVCKTPYELVAIIESEVDNAGHDITIKECYRPDSNSVGFTYRINDGSSPEEIDALIEKFTLGYDRLYGKSNSFNSSRHPVTNEEYHFKLNSAIRNATVEKTQMGTWVVRGDSDRFGDGVVLYESYNEDEAQDYLARVEASNQAEESGNKMRDDAQRYKGYLITGSERSGFVALSPYGRYCEKVFKTLDDVKAAIDEDTANSTVSEEDDYDLDSSRVDLNSGNVYEKADLNLESISNAMTTAIKDDPDTPTVLVQATDKYQAFLAPAGYDDNKLVVDGKIAEAEIYVTMFNGYKAIQVNGHFDNKMKGSEVVNYIQACIDKAAK